MDMVSGGTVDILDNECSALNDQEERKTTKTTDGCSDDESSELVGQICIQMALFDTKNINKLYKV